MSDINSLIEATSPDKDQRFENWMPHFVKAIKLFTQRLNKFADEALDISDLAKLFSRTGFTATDSKYFRAVFEPNKYMELVLEYWGDKGARAVKGFRELHRDSFNPYDEARVYGALNILVELDLLDYKILEYTTPKPTKIFISPMATAKQIEFAINFYEQDKIKWEQKQALQQTKKVKKEVVNVPCAGPNCPLIVIPPVRYCPTHEYLGRINPT